MRNIFRNIYLIIIISLILIVSSNNNIKFIEYKFSIITLKINGKGYKDVLSIHFDSDNYPNMIYINGIKQPTIKYQYNLNETDNFVKLIWNNSINDCERMFDECEDITEINFSDFDTLKVEYMSSMFSHCSSLSSLDLSNFDTSTVRYMDSMFSGCSSLSSLDLSNFNTSIVRDMSSMFSDCSSLSSLDLSNFDTSMVTTMSCMFSGCSSLYSLKLSNFNTSKVTVIYSIFSSCSSLSSLDLSNFDISIVTNINSMFSHCYSLSSLDLSNFKTSKVQSMSFMFYNCSSLSSLDLSNFITSKVTKMDYMFYNCSSLSSLDLSNFDTSIVTNINYIFYNCKILEYINLKNFIENELLSVTDIFYNVPDNATICLNENSTIIKAKINNGYILNCSVFDKEITKNNSISCYNISLNEQLCIKCNKDYYEIENDTPSSEKGYIKCYKDPKGYYLDKNISKYKKCFDTCNECEINGNNITHNCLKCNDNYTYEIKMNNYSNCYINCTYYHYFDNNNNYYCTLNSSCPEKFSKLIKDECVNITELNNTIEYLISNETVINTKEEEIEYYDTILKKLENIFTDKNYDTSELDNGKEEIIETGKITVTFTTTQNQKNNLNNNKTSIDFGGCEILLRKYYNLTNNQTLYMKKIEVIHEGFKIPKIEYDVYCKLNGSNLIKLNLSVCQNIKISLSIPIEITGSLDKLNSSSEYYNDICYTTISKSGTDIILKDRKDEYVNNTVCQDDCDFSDYNYTIKRANCSCKFKESSSSFADMNINIAKLLNNFKNIKNYANLNLLVCHKNLFSKEGLLKNVGFYIFIIIIIIRIINLFIFYLRQLNLLKNKIRNLILAIKNFNLIKKKNGNKEPRKKENSNFDNIDNEIGINNDNTFNRKKIQNKNMKKGKIKSKNKKNNFKKENTNIKQGKKFFKKKSKNINNNIRNKNNFINSNNINSINNNNISHEINRRKKRKNNNLLQNNSKSQDKLKFEKVEKIMDYNDDEINSLPYKLALQHDKRSYCQYYISLLRTKQSLLFSFYYSKDYNSKIIKIDLFFIGFSIYYTVNALFYSDGTMHNIYESKGSFNIEYQLPKIVYSTLISIFLNTVLKSLALSNSGILKFKKNKNKKNVNERGENLKNKLSIKFILYFIISFIFLLFFWYYISMFGAIYKNTQFHLLKDTFVSFGLSLLYPFAIYLLPGFFRIPSLANPKKTKECLYKFSKILQIF